MHFHFVFPRWQKLLEDHPDLRDVVSGYDVGNFRMAGLELATAAGAIPPGHTISLLDQNVADARFGIDADLVCIGFFTPQATNAYRLAEGFPSRAGRPAWASIAPVPGRWYEEDSLSRFATGYCSSFTAPQSDWLRRPTGLSWRSSCASRKIPGICSRNGLAAKAAERSGISAAFFPGNQCPACPSRL